ncbi:ornithine cyclodeaminase [Ensifer sp. SSB1]|uniref:ornithine cyclodeaminase family protein n=1 Tax=Ensifer sp. SSB1 TaxID=2795385 RepID=UPI001A4EDAF0|nr:ornithine cyclodeaminase [Ensifer sp. SSB1]MBK5567073.1 ornithine cyclodeaminase [Ensifer sp. SSB1]
MPSSNLRGVLSVDPPSLMSYDAVSPLLTWRGAVEAIRAGHASARPNQADILIGPSKGLLLNRAAFIEDLGYAVKAETVLPANAAEGLPSVQGAVLLFDAKTGSLRAVIDSKLVTEFKTAADSVLAAEILARPESRHLLIVGAGAVAKNLARAYSAAFPRLERISIWARRQQQAAELVSSLNDLGPDLSVAEDLTSAAASADIVSSATMAREPIILGRWVRAGTHVDLIGAFTPDMRESDDELIAKAKIYVDFRDTTVSFVGDLTQPIASGVISRTDILGDLYDLVAAGRPVRGSASDITVFKNGGGAHLDLMIANYVAEVVSRAKQ